MPREAPQFIGEYEDVPVDPKGRLIFPAAFRKGLPLGVSSLIVAQWFDGCLASFDPASWQSVIQRLRELQVGQKRHRQFIRKVAGLAAEVKIDRQGRALIPRKHLDMAGIADRATLVGVVDRVEIWNPDRYRQGISEINLEEVAEDMEWI